jgi:hypothetical protein
MKRQEKEEGHKMGVKKHRHHFKLLAILYEEAGKEWGT